MHINLAQCILTLLSQYLLTFKDVLIAALLSCTVCTGDIKHTHTLVKECVTSPNLTLYQVFVGIVNESHSPNLQQIPSRRAAYLLM